MVQQIKSALEVALLVTIPGAGGLPTDPGVSGQNLQIAQLAGGGGRTGGGPPSSAPGASLPGLPAIVGQIQKQIGMGGGSGVTS